MCRCSETKYISRINLRNFWKARKMKRPTTAKCCKTILSLNYYVSGPQRVEGPTLPGPGTKTFEKGCIILLITCCLFPFHHQKKVIVSFPLKIQTLHMHLFKCKYNCCWLQLMLETSSCCFFGNGKTQFYGAREVTRMCLLFLKCNRISCFELLHYKLHTRFKSWTHVL